MKYFYLILIALFISSCGGKDQSIKDIIATQDLTQIRKSKQELGAKKQKIEAELALLESEIKKLDPQEKFPLITALTLKKETFNHYLELQGNVATKKNLVVFPEFSGILTSVNVREGQKVRKGQQLAKISDGGLSQQLAQIKIQANLAKTTFERQEALWKKDIGTEMQFLQAKSNYEAQQTAVKQIQSQIEKTIVRAPFSGVIDDVIAEQGSVVAPGQSQLFRIVSLNEMYIETDVPERYITEVTKNKEVEVEFPILNKKIKTKVRQAGNFINPANRTFKIEVAVPGKDQSIKPNLTAKVRIKDYTNKEAILISQGIISENAEGQQYVYVVTDKKDNKATAKRVIIETGRTQGDMIEVLSGLAAEDEIIVEGARSVKDGQLVKFLSK